MNRNLVEQIRRNLEGKTTEELTRIYREHKESEWSEDAFEAMHQLLVERGETVREPQHEGYIMASPLVCDKCGTRIAPGNSFRNSPVPAGQVWCSDCFNSKPKSSPLASTWLDNVRRANRSNFSRGTNYGIVGGVIGLIASYLFIPTILGTKPSLGLYLWTILSYIEDSSKLDAFSRAWAANTISTTIVCILVGTAAGVGLFMVVSSRQSK